MALFAKADATVTIRRSLDVAITARTKLSARLAAAETAVTAATASAQRLALNDATDDALDKAEGILRAAQARAETLTRTLTERSSVIDKIKSDLAVATHEKDCCNTISTIGELGTEFETVMTGLGAALAKAEPVVERLSAFIPEAKALHTPTNMSIRTKFTLLIAKVKFVPNETLATGNNFRCVRMRAPLVVWWAQDRCARF